MTTPGPARALVVVTTYERPRHLRLSLRGFLRQTSRDFALVVADDGSGPETAAVVRAFAAAAPFAVTHVRQEHEGFRRAAILNEAVRRSGGEPLLVFTDGDCVAPPEFVARHVAAHGPRSFAVAGGHRLERDEAEPLTEADVDAGRVEALVPAAKRRKRRRHGRETRLATWLRRPGHPRVVGLNVAVDRRLFEEVNGYDEAFVGYGHEDDDLRDRLMATRPRPRVRVLWGRNDVVHLWHPAVESHDAMPNVAYYRTARPSRCAKGLARSASDDPADL